MSIDTQNHPASHLRHFVVQTRTFQIEKSRNVDMYAHLRVYIRRQNEKRKQEMEMSEELKRAKREKELKHKRDKLTLGEIKDEISKHDSKLNELQNEKHRLFAEFKKVLNEDETKKVIQRQRETNAFNSITFGPVATSTVAPSRVPNPQPLYSNVPIQQSPQLVVNNAHNVSNANQAIINSSLHHQMSNPIASVYYSPQHPSGVVTSAPSNAPMMINHHRLNGRVPTPTSSFASHRSQPSQPIYSKPLPMTQLPLSSMSVSPSAQSLPTSSSQYQNIQNERLRLSYKRTHDQASVPMNLQNSVGGPVSIPGSMSSAQSQHMPYLANYKQLGQQPMPPPVYSPQLAGQHVIPHPTLEQFQNQQLYHSLLNSYAMASANPMYNPNSK